MSGYLSLVIAMSILGVLYIIIGTITCVVKYVLRRFHR